MLFGFLLSLDCLHGRSALGMRVSCVIFSTQAILAWSVCGFSNMGKKKWTRPRASKRSDPSQTLKRGCLRLKATASHSGGGSAKKHADYVPECQQEASQPRRGREELSISGSALRALPLRKLVKHLQDFGHLPCAGTKSPCLHCGLRTLSTQGAQDVPSVLQGTGQKCYRCTKKSCNKQQHVLSKSPVFYVGRGTDSPSLTTQACVLWHLAWRTPSRLVRAELHLNEKRIDAMRHRWRAVLSQYVEATQSASQGGNFTEVEVDECVLRKQVVGDAVAWQGWMGSKVRGQRTSLVLEKRPFHNSLSATKTTGRSAPPPLSVGEWQDVRGFGVFLYVQLRPINPGLVS